MNNKIQVVELDVKKIGLILHNAKNAAPEGANNPYVVALMVNAGSEGVPAYPQWISISITIDPLGNIVTYTANSGFKLSDAQKAAVEDIIEKAIRFQETSVESEVVVNAFPNAERVSGTILSQDTGKPSGYKALHDLYSNTACTDLVANNESAKSFANIKDDFKAVKQAVYKYS